jgi:hypothetical protein
MSNVAKNVEAGRAGKNAWVQWGGRDGDTIVAYARSEEWPGENWSPYYPASRVKGDTYEYYNGRSTWEIAANESMASEANSNFRRGQSY